MIHTVDQRDKTDMCHLSSRKRQRLQIRLKSLCIEKKEKVKKIRVKDSVCICAIRELFLTFVL